MICFCRCKRPRRKIEEPAKAWEGTFSGRSTTFDLANTSTDLSNPTVWAAFAFMTPWANCIVSGSTTPLKQAIYEAESFDASIASLLARCLNATFDVDPGGRSGRPPGRICSCNAATLLGPCQTQSYPLDLKNNDRLAGPFRRPNRTRTVPRLSLCMTTFACGTCRYTVNAPGLSLFRSLSPSSPVTSSSKRSSPGLSSGSERLKRCYSDLDPPVVAPSHGRASTNLFDCDCDCDCD